MYVSCNTRRIDFPRVDGLSIGNPGFGASQFFYYKKNEYFFFYD